MNKEEIIMVLTALSKLEGYVLGKTGTHIPEDLGEEVSNASFFLVRYLEKSA